MGFYWRGDQLYTRSGPVSLAESKNETIICLKLREPLDCPDLDHFSQFLGKAVLFTANLQQASFSIDGQLQFKVEKTAEPEAVDDLKLIAGAVLKSTSTGLFTLKSLQPQILNISIDKSFQSPEPSLTSQSTSFLSGLWRLAQSHLTEKGRQESALEEQLRLPGKFALTLKYLRGVAAVGVSSRFAAEMERTTKKKPFSQVFIDLIWSAGPEQTESIKHPVLKYLIPCERGKVYIGFETHQSTGLGAHLAAPFIPTVERESIDFVDGCLRQWNLELLQVAGKLSRLIYERELKIAVGSVEALKMLLKTFNFTDSTPAQHVCIALFREFLDQKEEIRLPGQNGKLVPISQLRYIPTEMQPFMKNCPQVPAELEEACALFLQKLQASTSKKSLPIASHADVIQFELKQRQLSIEEAIILIKWWSKTAPKSIELNREFSISLKIVHPHNQVALPLAQFSLLPVEELIALHTTQPDWLAFWPVDCLPVKVAEEVGDLLKGMKGFTVAEWLEGLAKNSAAKEAIQTDLDRAERLLLFCSKQWDHSNEMDQGRIASVLSSIACIPVASGVLKLPRQCFFDDVAREGLLPADSVLACSSDIRRSRLNAKMLKAAGMQSHLPLESVLKSSSAASLSTLQYLFKHREELSRQELESIRVSEIFPSSAGSLCKLSELFAPSAVSKQLGLPNLSWTDPLPREGSDLAAFMEQLGFNYTVSWRLVLGGIAQCKRDPDRMQLLRYFFEHFAEYESFRPAEVDFPFIPVQGDHGGLLLLPSQVFLDEELDLLGFYLLPLELRKWALQLGVAERPSSAFLTQQICKSRLEPEAAKKLFAYLSKVSFSPADVALLNQASFIPCSNTTFKAPKQVFFKPTGSNEQGFAELFDQVDFGAAGNAFLRVAGVEDEPTIEHLVKLLSADSKAIFTSIGVSRYIRMMEKLAAGWAAFSRENSALVKAFAAAPAFLASIKSEVTKNEKDSKDNDEDCSMDSAAVQYQLYKANEAFLIDDTIAQQIFNLPAVPSQLNDFYAQLGCKWISSAVKTEWKRSGKPESSGPLAKEVQKTLDDRLTLISSSLESANRRGRKKLISAKIYQVDSIKISRYCQPLKKEDLQAVCAYTDGQGIYVSYSKGREFDSFDLASVVVELLCEQKGKVQDALLVATLLTTSLASLRAKGFKIQEPEAPEPLEEIKPIPIEPVERSKPTTISAPTPSKPISPMVPEAEKLLTDSSPKPSTSTKPDSLSEQQRPQSQPAPEPTRPESPNAIKSLFGLLKQSTESFISKLNTSNSPSPNHRQPGSVGRARDEGSMQETLRQGINSLRKHKNDALEAAMNEADRAPPEPAPQVNRKQARDFCCEDTRLKFYSVVGAEQIRFYFPLDMDDESCASKYSQFNAALISFYGLIVERLGRGVFGIFDLQTVALFYDPDSSAIAFNHGQSLFFNFAYYLANKHHQTPDVMKVRSFWFITFCHELAHNFVLPHNAEHEYFMSCFLESYMPTFYSQLNK